MAFFCQHCIRVVDVVWVGKRHEVGALAMTYYEDIATFHFNNNTSYSLALELERSQHLTLTIMLFQGNTVQSGLDTTREQESPANSGQSAFPHGNPSILHLRKPVTCL